MPSSSWDHYLAIGGCLGVLLLAIPALGQEAAPGAVIENSDAASENSNADTAEEPGPGNQFTPEAEPPSGGEISAQPAEPIADQGNRYPNCEFDSVEECDLAAQQSMAESTAFMNRAAWVGILLTVLGLGLLWRTMRYTKDAAIYAERAATAAEDAVNVTKFWSDKTITASRKAVKRQIRAYLDVGAAIREEEKSPKLQRRIRVQFEVRNTGQTPARAVLLKLGSQLCVSEGDVVGEFCRREGRSDLGPGGIHAHTYTLIDEVPETAWRAFLNEELTLYFFGEVTYMTIFGDKKWTKFRLRFDRRSLPDGIFYVCERGNEGI